MGVVSFVDETLILQGSWTRSISFFENLFKAPIKVCGFVSYESARLLSFHQLPLCWIAFVPFSLRMNAVFVMARLSTSCRFGRLVGVILLADVYFLTDWPERRLKMDPSTHVINRFCEKVLWHSPLQGSIILECELSLIEAGATGNLGK